MSEIFDLDLAQKNIDKARDKVSQLCRGNERWIMRIPAEPINDPDLVISRALRDADALISLLRNLRGHLWAISAYHSDPSSVLVSAEDMTFEERLAGAGAQADAALSLIK